MSDGDRDGARLWRAALMQAAPAGAALAGAAALGAIAWPAALAVFVVAAVGSTWWARRRIAGLAALEARVAELDESWRRRSAELAHAVAANDAMLDSIPDPLLLVDADLEIARANPAARALFGDDAVGRGLAAVLRDPAVLEATEECLAGGAPEAVGFELPGPVERFFSVRAAPLVAGLDAPRRALLALHDETGIRRAQRMRADFVANVSHELRTPLATLLGFIETLRGPARDDAEARERFLGIMNEQTVRMSRLVRDLLSLSKIEESELTPPTGRVDLAAVLGSVVDGLSLQAKAREVRVVLDLPAGLPPAQGDADQLSQVFQNLLDNAIAYGRARDEVRVAVAVVAAPPGMPAPGRALAVAVADRGEGIPREHLSRLTERFYRIDTGRSRRMGGTGLGLAIAKHIVNRHRGALRIESEVGKGSVFTVYLPVSADAWTPSVATARR